MTIENNKKGNYKVNQDKILFCIAQLEKVKWLVEDIQIDYGDNYNISRDFLIKEIEKHINQLKEG